MRFSVVLGTLALSTVAFAQSFAPQDGPFQIGYAANLNIGDSVVNITNDGFRGGVFPPLATSNICADIFVFDPREEEIGCCACLITPNGLNSLSVKSDLISNNLTPDVPTSVVIKIFGQNPAPGTVPCNAATLANPTSDTTLGLLVWGTTLEPSSTPGTYNAVSVPFQNANIVGGFSANGGSATPTTGQEEASLAQLCNFIQSNGSGFGLCKSCRLGALGGSKQ